jgi:hypothetical protein
MDDNHDFDNLVFDEVDANALYGAILHQLKTINWDVSEPGQWALLSQLKKLEDRIGRYLDGAAI